MSLEVMLVVLLSGLLHASWNALIRGSANRTLDTVLVVGAAGLIIACWLPFAPLPARASWPYIAASATIHVGYFLLMAMSYRHGELSFAYPIMRGSAPALSAIVAAAVLVEVPAPAGWLGIFLVSAGILLIAADSWRLGSFHPRSALFAIGTACVIVVYTLVDGVGARLSAQPFSYTGWLFLLTAIPLVALFMFRDPEETATYLRRHWRRGLIGGACTFASYALVLWAMTQAPIALAAALRETSVVFAVLIAAIVLREQISRLRYAAIAVVIAGAVAIKLA